MKKIRIKNKGIFVIFALYLNPIIIGGLETFFYLLIYGSAMFYIVLNSEFIFNNYLKRINIKHALPMIWVLIALLLSVLVPSIQGTGDYTYVNVILGVFRKAIILIFLFLLISRHIEKNAVIETFMYYYSISSILYVCSTIVFTLLPSIRNAWQGVLRLNNSTLNILTSYGYTNRFGWAGFAGFRNTIDCTISLIFLIYLYSGVSSKYNIKTKKFVFLAFMCFLGNMFYGRSGVIASVLCLFVGLLFYKKITPKVLISIIGVVAAGFLLINVLRNRIQAVDEWFTWISTPFYNLVMTGSFNNYSANRLLNEMIFLPSRNTFLFGDGRYVDATTGYYYMRTDSGFMRQILFWGIGATALTYSCWLYTLLTMKRDWIMKVMLLIMCVLFEIKGEVYYELLPLFLIIGMIDYKVGKSPELECIMQPKRSRAN